MLENNERKKYICPEKNCNLIPRILNVHSDTGRIAMQCPNNHLNEIDIQKYMKILDEKKHIEPIGENLDLNDSYESDNSESKILEKKCEDISNIINAYSLLLLAQEKHPDNYINNKNLINLGNQIKNENKNISNSIDSNYETLFDDVINELKEEKEREETALEILETEYGIYLKEHYQNKNFCLILKGSENEYRILRDGGFGCISQIRFKNLIELNLANNEIKDITYLDNMLLPHLEILNLSYNRIRDVKPVANLLSEKLVEIYLQYNDINNLKPLQKIKFPIDSLEIFRIDNNRFDINSPDIQLLAKKFKNNILIYENKTWNDFNNKYNCNINKNDIKFDLGLKMDSNIIFDLFPLIAIPNNIKILILDYNKIKDASLIAKIPLYYLEYLDLSLNNITNIKFLIKLSDKCKNLKLLFLHDNKINNISPLYNNNGVKEEAESEEESEEEKNCLILRRLEALTLKGNNLDLQDRITYDILDSFIKNENLAFDYKENDLPLMNYNSNIINT